MYAILEYTLSTNFAQSIRAKTAPTITASGLKNNGDVNSFGYLYRMVYYRCKCLYHKSYSTYYNYQCRYFHY